MNKNQIKEIATSFKKMAKAFSDICNITKIINDTDDKSILSYLCQRVGWVRLFIEVNPLQIKFEPERFGWYKDSFIYNKGNIESKSTDLLRSFKINYHGTSNMFQAVTLIGQQFNMIVNKLKKYFPSVEEEDVFHPKKKKTTKKDHRDNSRNDIHPITRISKMCDRDLPYQIRRITRISFFEEEVEYVRMTCDPSVSMSKLMMRKHHLDKLWEDYISYNQFKNEVVDDLQGFIDDLDNFDDLNLDSFEDGVKDRSTKRNSVIRTSILHGVIKRNQKKI